MGQGASASQAPHTYPCVVLKKTKRLSTVYTRPGASPVSHPKQSQAKVGDSERPRSMTEPDEASLQSSAASSSHSREGNRVT